MLKRIGGPCKLFKEVLRMFDDVHAIVAQTPADIICNSI